MPNTFEEVLDITAGDLITVPTLLGQMRVGCCKVSQYGSGNSWSNLNDARFYNDSKYASVSLNVVPWVIFQDFKFSAPSSAVIRSIVPTLRGHQENQNPVAAIYNVGAVKGGVIYPICPLGGCTEPLSESGTELYSAAPNDKVLSSGDLAGHLRTGNNAYSRFYASWTVADINSPEFGIAFRFWNFGSAGSLFIDSPGVAVYYV